MANFQPRQSCKRAARYLNPILNAFRCSFGGIIHRRNSCYLARTAMYAEHGEARASRGTGHKPNFHRCPVSALNGRATAPGKCSVPRFPCSHLCLCVQVCAEPHRVKCIVTSYTNFAGVPPYVVRIAAYRTAIRVPASRFYPSDLTRALGLRTASSSRHPRCCESVQQQPGTLAATAMERNLHNFLKERGHLDLREFEEYCASPASPDPHSPSG
ncbi:hypothetical protein EVAR_101301_1 [Eumeta japonica]|uniref:Uncharacterized protein n=1 Tax=Eumeta variegata TaxID=151549 RepID=A0A4C1SP52_EUMVA|nr:hypothetical protein EVAR_101301_1 [Eumeta japonica]